MYIAMRVFRHGRTASATPVLLVLLATGAHANQAALVRSRQADRLWATGLSSAEHCYLATAALYCCGFGTGSISFTNVG